MPAERDALYSLPRDEVADFAFDERVAAVFPDMINRSVPGYAYIVSMIGIISREYAQARSQCYDLGCSLGAATRAMAMNVDQPGCRIIGVDNSQAMIDAARNRLAPLKSKTPLKFICGDVQRLRITMASVVVLNFTLQFIDPARRETLLQRIFDGLLPGGALILSEKIAYADAATETCLTQLHHAFKKANGYSALEIAQKRTALENVLIPETQHAHFERLRAVGFQQCTVWFQCFNFVSMLCVKTT